MEVEQLLQARVQELSFYSAYSFLREFSTAEQVEFFVKPKIDSLRTASSDHVTIITIDGARVVFILEHLPWDSTFFNRSCYKLFTVLYPPCEPSNLIQAIQQFKTGLLKHKEGYCFIELPSEDVFLLQCLTAAGLKLVETRLHYYKKDLQSFTGERYPVREATLLENEALALVAKQQRNPFDRTHADYSFSNQEADAYLAKYAHEALNGFCTGVLVPDEESQPVDAFLAYNYYQDTLPSKLLKRYHVALTAVAPSYKGGLYKLLSELVYLANTEEASYVTYTTQSTNRAAIRTCEKLGFRFARTTHILSFSS